LRGAKIGGAYLILNLVVRHFVVRGSYCWDKRLCCKHAELNCELLVSSTSEYLSQMVL
jgi:hypothetical protein